MSYQCLKHYLPEHLIRLILTYLPTEDRPPYLEYQRSMIAWFIKDIVPRVRSYPQWGQIVYKQSPLRLLYRLNTNTLDTYDKETLSESKHLGQV